MFFYSLINEQIESCLLLFHSSSFFGLNYFTYLIKYSLVFFVIEKRFNVSIEQMRDISDYTQGLLENLLDESKRLENHAMRADEIQMRSIAEFQKAYEVGKTNDFTAQIFYFLENI